MMHVPLFSSDLFMNAYSKHRSVEVLLTICFSCELFQAVHSLHNPLRQVPLKGDSTLTTLVSIKALEYSKHFSNLPLFRIIYRLADKSIQITHNS